MQLTAEERAMLAGEFGEVRRWAISHQIAVGEFFDAADFVPVSQAHMMADTCINYQTIMAPVRGDHLAYGDTGVVIYSNSVLVLLRQ
jgi:predicted aconitase